MASPKPESGPHIGEFIAMMALMTSLVALSIDLMLPALADIGTDLGSPHANANQLVVTMVFAGLAIGQLVYGPLSDSTGRKPAIYLGYAVFGLGSLLTILAANFPMMLAGRLLQGLGVAGPRGVSIALIRDRFAGREMARVMSFMMVVYDGRIHRGTNHCPGIGTGHPTCCRVANHLRPSARDRSCITDLVWDTAARDPHTAAKGTVVGEADESCLARSHKPSCYPRLYADGWSSVGYASGLPRLGTADISNPVRTGAALSTILCHQCPGNRSGLVRQRAAGNAIRNAPAGKDGTLCTVWTDYSLCRHNTSNQRTAGAMDVDGVSHPMLFLYGHSFRQYECPGNGTARPHCRCWRSRCEFAFHLCRYCTERSYRPIVQWHYNTASGRLCCPEPHSVRPNVLGRRNATCSYPRF